MKIIRDDIVYVQKRDIDVLTSSNYGIPMFILLERYNKFEQGEDPFEWVSFHEPEAIQYFDNIDWILDYDYVKTLPEKKIVSMFQKVMKRKNVIKKQYPNIEENEENIRHQLKDLWNEYILLEYQENALLNILLWKQGKKDMPLPAGLELKSNVYHKLEKLFFKRHH